MPDPAFAWGTYRFIKSAATGSWQAVGITLVGKTEFQLTPAAGIAPPVAAMELARAAPPRLYRTSAKTWPPRAAAKSSRAGLVAREKPPAGSASVGTGKSPPDWLSILRLPPNEAKKKV